MWKAMILDALQYEMFFSNATTVALINIYCCRKIAIFRAAAFISSFCVMALCSLVYVYKHLGVNYCFSPVLLVLFRVLSAFY